MGNPELKVTWPVYRIQTWRDFIERVRELSLDGMGGGAWIYRGQPASRWSLVPSLARVLIAAGLNAKDGIRLEKQLDREFTAEAHLRLSDPCLEDGGSRGDRFMLMQHYGASTRVLDWTTSPYVGAYFAANALPGEDGALWAFNSHRLMHTLHDLGRLPSMDPEGKIDRLILNEDGPLLVMTLGPKAKSRRLSSQQGLFTACSRVLADHQNAIGEILLEGLGKPRCFDYCAKFEVPNESKLVFMKNLRLANVTAKSLFPEIDGLGKSTAEFAHTEALTTAYARKKGIGLIAEWMEDIAKGTVDAGEGKK